MKYLKMYEVNKGITKEFKRKDIILSSDRLYLVLNDVSKNDKTFQVFHIGMLYNRVVLLFNTKYSNASSIFNNGFVAELNKTEKEMLYEAIDDNTYEKYLRIIKEYTGIDLKKLEGYKEYLIKKDINKYNL